MAQRVSTSPVHKIWVRNLLALSKNHFRFVDPHLAGAYNIMWETVEQVENGERIWHRIITLSSVWINPHHRMK